MKTYIVPGFGKVKSAMTIVPSNAHAEGDIWKLLKENSPMWTEQWGYQGSANTPYIISHRSTDVGKGTNGSTTSDGWACSCPNFTRHTPRTPCKHILNVMVKNGCSDLNKASVSLANVDIKKMEEFQKWQREQAALKKNHKVTAGAKLNLFGATIRKFR